MTKYNVIFRACDAVHSVHGAPRPFGLDKTTLIKICFLSLYNSLKNYPHTIHILGDKLSIELQTFFKQFPVTLSNGTYGNDESIRQSFRMGLEFPDDEWVYFCEDDYLHVPETFLWIDEFIQNRMEILKFEPRRAFMKLFVNKLEDKPLFIFPSDYPDRYAFNQKKPSYIFLSQYCHWRQVSHSTFTFLGETKSLKKYKKALFESAIRSRDGYLSGKLYGRLLFMGRGLCVCPIPGIATHMHDDQMTPLIDWQRLYELGATELKKMPSPALVTTT
jgi:hypothetical protein